MKWFQIITLLLSAVSICISVYSLGWQSGWRAGRFHKSGPPARNPPPLDGGRDW